MVSCGSLALGTSRLILVGVVVGWSRRVAWIRHTRRLRSTALREGWWLTGHLAQVSPSLENRLRTFGTSGSGRSFSLDLRFWGSSPGGVSRPRRPWRLWMAPGYSSVSGLPTSITPSPCWGLVSRAALALNALSPENPFNNHSNNHSNNPIPEAPCVGLTSNVR